MKIVISYNGIIKSLFKGLLNCLLLVEHPVGFFFVVYLFFLCSVGFVATFLTSFLCSYWAVSIE